MAQPRHGFRAWLLTGLQDRTGSQQGPHAATVEKTHSWWRVMCLTGVDYFSTLGYQPAIAALAAGLLSPFATIVLVVITLAGALPVYRRVAGYSYKGAGSIAMLEKLVPSWGGKLVVLVLLGFAATDFMITITLSAADATAHAVENPFAPSWFHGSEIWITLILLALLAAVFLRGFKEAITLAMVLVGAYLALNAVVVVVGLVQVIGHPVVVGDWWSALTRSPTGSNWALALGFVLLTFPRLALGLSGFETGVAVMPQIRASEADGEKPLSRIRDTKRLLTTAALIMSTFLILSSIITTVLIPQKEFQPDGEANGRALAYLAHLYLGSGFGTVYDISTILILWFAGASAMAGLLNLVPRYLPKYGMAPHWAAAVRPLVIVFAVIAVVVTLVFRADVDAQAGAYATGVLVLITSASLAVMLASIRRKQWRWTVLFAVVLAIFIYTTIANIIERPDGVRIAGLFILGILVVSIISRVQRSFQLRATSLQFDEVARDWFMADADDGGAIRIIANEPDDGTMIEYKKKAADERRDSGIPQRDPVIFLEVHHSDSSDFEEDLLVRGESMHGYRVMKVTSGNVPNTIATILLAIRDETGVIPNVYFEWTEGSPVNNMMRYLLTGVGEVAPVTREVLRRAEPNPVRRPAVHVS